MDFPVEQIQNMIYEIRGQRVMLDSDLAKLYGVEVRVLNQSVKRNIRRFPEDFMFKLTKEEYEFLKSQIVTSKVGRGGKQKQSTLTAEKLASIKNDRCRVNFCLYESRIKCD